MVAARFSMKSQRMTPAELCGGINGFSCVLCSNAALMWEDGTRQTGSACLVDSQCKKKKTSGLRRRPKRGRLLKRTSFSSTLDISEWDTMLFCSRRHVQKKRLVDH